MMDAKTLEALKGSIAKWEGIVAGTMKDLGHINCPLCTLFWTNHCRGCPVKNKTGEAHCDGTPYREYEDGLRDAAQAELDFLKSLLPSADAE